MQTVTVIGAGNVGAALARVLARQGCTVLDVCNRTKESAERACGLIGGGRAAAMDELRPADIVMIAVSDNAIGPAAAALAQTGAVRPGTIVFHCSGSIPSSILTGLCGKGALVAAIHPVKTFADKARDSETFAGTWCGVEGDKDALAVLGPLFEKAGAHVFAVDPEKKTLYHAASVFMCSYIFPLLEAGLQCYEAAGVDRQAAALIAGPLARAAVDNALSQGPGKTMTGPLSRGDDAVVERQREALFAWRPELGVLYEALGAASLPLARQKGAASEKSLQSIARLLRAEKYGGAI